MRWLFPGLPAPIALQWIWDCEGKEIDQKRGVGCWVWGKIKKPQDRVRGKAPFEVWSGGFLRSNFSLNSFMKEKKNVFRAESAAIVIRRQDS